jgi:hypothetical protein
MKARALLALIATVTSLLVLEGMLRLTRISTHYQWRFDQKPNAHRSISVDGAPERGWVGGLYQSTPSGRRLRPNVDGVIRNHALSHRDVPIRTNSLGLRGPEVDLSWHPRLLFLGDSITLADYLEEEATFTRQIETLAIQAGQPWQVLNSGVGGIGTEAEFSILKELAPRTSPDWTVLNLYLNDVQPSASIELITMPRLLQSSWIAQHLFQLGSVGRYYLATPSRDSISRATWEQWRAETKARFPGGTGDYDAMPPAFYKLVHDHFSDWGSAWHPAARDRILQSIDAISAYARERHIRVAVVLHPVRFQVETVFLEDTPQKDFLEQLSRKGIPTLDLLPHLRAFQGEKAALFYDQCHHTALGSELVARAIYPFLRTRVSDRTLAGGR